MYVYALYMYIYMYICTLPKHLQEVSMYCWNLDLKLARSLYLFPSIQLFLSFSIYIPFLPILSFSTIDRTRFASSFLSPRARVRVGACGSAANW